MAATSKKSPASHASTPAEAAVESLTLAAPDAVEAAPLASESVTEIQEKVRAALEKGVVESKAAFAKAKASADEAANAFEQSFAAAKDGAVAINVKAIEALRVNAEANFDFWKATFRVRSLSDLVALQGEFARKQVETVTGQVKDIGQLTQKTVAEAYAPIKDQVAKSFRVAV